MTTAAIDPITNPGESTAAQAATPAAAATVTPPVTTPPAPDWLPARLERERQSVLRELGIESPTEAKKALEAYKAAEEAKKTTEEKNAELARDLKALNKHNESLTGVLKTYAESMLAPLDEAKKAAVIALAGDDPAKQLAALNALQPTWSQAAPAATPPAKIENTAPPPNAPSQGITAPTNHRSVYLSLQEQDPISAARYAAKHPDSYKR